MPNATALALAQLLVLTAGPLKREQECLRTTISACAAHRGRDQRKVACATHDAGSCRPPATARRGISGELFGAVPLHRCSVSARAHSNRRREERRPRSRYS
jgi:hypothetical protein